MNSQSSASGSTGSLQQHLFVAAAAAGRRVACLHPTRDDAAGGEWARRLRWKWAAGVCRAAALASADAARARCVNAAVTLNDDVLLHDAMTANAVLYVNDVSDVGVLHLQTPSPTFALATASGPCM